MIWLKRAAKTDQDAARAVTFAFFMLPVVLLIAYIPTISTAMLPDIYK